MPSDTPPQAAPKPGSKWGSGLNHEHRTELLIDTHEALRRLCIGERTLWSLVKRGAIPSRKVGRSVRFAPAELAAWVEAGCPTEPGAAARIVGRKGVGR